MIYIKLKLVDDSETRMCPITLSEVALRDDKILAKIVRDAIDTIWPFYDGK